MHKLTKYKGLLRANALLGLALAFALTLVVGPGTAFASGSYGSNVTYVSGTFRTPTGGAASCPGVPEGTDCQIDKFFGSIGGPDDGVNPGADDKLTTVFIHEDVPAPGFWTYKDLEEITDTRGVFRGDEYGIIDARPGLSTTGNFAGVYHGKTDDGCYVLDFVIRGVIDISGIVDQSSNPVNIDSGSWAGFITKKC